MAIEFCFCDFQNAISGIWSAPDNGTGIPIFGTPIRESELSMDSPPDRACAMISLLVTLSTSLAPAELNASRIVPSTYLES